MAIKVYNTLTKKKEEFVPLHPGKAYMYVCGVTPYNHPHIGNARPFVTWDVIRRFWSMKVMMFCMYRILPMLTIKSSTRRIRKACSGATSAGVISTLILK